MVTTVTTPPILHDHRCCPDRAKALCLGSEQGHWGAEVRVTCEVKGPFFAVFFSHYPIASPVSAEEAICLNTSISQACQPRPCRPAKPSTASCGQSKNRAWSVPPCRSGLVAEADTGVRRVPLLSETQSQPPAAFGLWFTKLRLFSPVSKQRGESGRRYPWNKWLSRDVTPSA